MFQDLISFLTSGVDIFTNNPLTLQISGYIFPLAFGDETNPFYHLVFKHIYGWDVSMCLYCLPVPFLKGIRVNYIGGKPGSRQSVDALDFGNVEVLENNHLPSFAKSDLLLIF